MSATIKKTSNRQISILTFNIIIAFLLIVLYNFVFFDKLQNLGMGWLFNLGVGTVLIALMTVCCNLLLWRYTAKPLVAVICIINAFCMFFMLKYHIAIDKIMLINLLETDSAEAGDLWDWKLPVWMILCGLLPAFAVSRLPIDYRHRLWQRAVIGLSAIALVAVIIFPNYKNTAQMLRNHREIKYYLLPVNYIGAVISTIKIYSHKNHKIVAIGQDARYQPYWQNGKPNLFVLVVGETARSANFSLNGYGQKTNPELEKATGNLFSYRNFSSCATSTAISLPCMFSASERSKFKTGSGDYTENVLDILNRNGYEVLWRENNSGCKGVCKRISTEQFCKNYACNDLILLDNLDKKTADKSKNHWIVMHQQGSHGPAYYQRYPKEFEQFKPACQNQDLSKCSNQEIVNAYDNSLLFTDYVLAQTVKFLSEAEKDYNVALFYISDHGESLGEKGIYLHAAPYIIAPAEQTAVPALFWIGNQSAEALGLNLDCLAQKLDQNYSHDNIFHTLLGLSGVYSSEYKPELDLLAQCRNLGR